MASPGVLLHVLIILPTSVRVHLKPEGKSSVPQPSGAHCRARPGHADIGAHPDLLNSRFGYVSISRGSHEAMLFTNDAGKLNQELGSNMSKTSALEISQSPGVTQGIGTTL